MLSGLWFSDIYFRLQWPQMAPRLAKNDTLMVKTVLRLNFMFPRLLTYEFNFRVS